MGLSLIGRRVYTDTSSFIHSVEGYAIFPELKAGFLDLIDAGWLVAVTSELTLLETMVGPRKSGNAAFEQEYRELLSSASLVAVRPIDTAVLEKAIDLRLLGLKTPDAIHVATGMLEGCDAFLTRDHGWARAGVRVVDPAEVV